MSANAATQQMPDDADTPVQDGGDDTQNTGTSPPPAAPDNAPPTDDTQAPTSDASADDVFDFEPIQAPPVAQYNPTPQELDARSAEFFQDNASGRVSPESYSQLMGKDTMGKIGSFVGLLLSGMGSGVLGQPNAVMQMMDKTLDRNLQAQQYTKTNTMNLYNAAMTHEMNLSQISLQGAEQRYKDALTSKIPTEIEQAKLNLQVTQQNIRQSAITMAKNYQDVMITNGLMKQGDKIAPGQLKQIYDQMMQGVIAPGMQGRIQQRNQQTGAAVQLRNSQVKPAPNSAPMTATDPDGNPMTEADFTQNWNKAQLDPRMKAQWDFAADHHIEGLPGLSNQPVVSSGKDQEINNRANYLLQSKRLLDEVSKNKVGPTVADALKRGDIGNIPAEYQRQATKIQMLQGAYPAAHGGAQPPDFLSGSPFGVLSDVNRIPQMQALLGQDAQDLQARIGALGYNPKDLKSLLQARASKLPDTQDQEVQAPSKSPVSDDMELRKTKEGKQAYFKDKKFVRYK